MLKRVKTLLHRYEHTLVFALVRRYVEDDLGSKAASLAYYFLFSVFPLLILAASLIGGLQIEPDALAKACAGFLPASIIEMMTTYLAYIKQSYNTTILIFSLVFSVYFPFRAIKELMQDVRASFRQPDRTRPKTYILRQLLCTVLMPATLFFSLLLIVLGQNVIEYFLHWFLPDTIHLSRFLLSLWQYARFVAAAGLMALSLGALYAFSLDRVAPIRTIAPGIVFAILLWIASSVCFSFYVENYANYSLIYGTLGALIVLLLWLYLTSLILILGSELNAIRAQKKESRNQ
ncbi:YihY/virulence factor BrkB family protein [uncultured Dubosiella sp.]|uniref:YihY/virulence factor BrkB family protein n=1 Tax=uncultured Dubosiella sp. TaxID=1937011 RepID=UPI002731CA2F|nr:YihY/virulence factor BrkB family protein [uncultured Dubosiella sp.]